ncbi:MAG: DUF2252 family protein [Deltaproteobacteria bacterium]|nr:DUF2252 family protein [Deltaproteobacteria bacterium]
MHRLLLLGLLAACGDDARSAREQRVIDTLAEDNHVWGQRDPELVMLKLAKMQRNDYEWMRGTAGLYWRDVADGDPRVATAFPQPRVLIIGDPHPENLGTFRAADGTMLVDWNDLDAAGYGPAIADLRRLAVGMVIGTDGNGDDQELVSRIVHGYTAQIAMHANGGTALQLGTGVHPLIDSELADARVEGDRRLALDELAPVMAGARVLAVGDLEDVGKDGVYEDTVRAVDAAEAARIDAAVAQWAARRGEAAIVKLRARRIGAGVASYAALRYNVVLEGPTPALADDVLIELKEGRDGSFLDGAITLRDPTWVSPAERVADAQRRVQARGDADVRLGFADVSGLSFKIRDREAYQRGLAHSAIDDLDRQDLLAFGEILGRRLASAHGASLTGQGLPGWMAIAPALAGRELELADELSVTALAEAAQIRADHDAFEDADLAALVLPRAH